MKYILRILAVPFVFGIITIRAVYQIFYESCLFLLYGGEMINYREKNARKTIADIFQKLKENHEQ